MTPAAQSWLRWALAGAVLAAVVIGADRLGHHAASGLPETPTVSAEPTVPPGVGVVSGVVKFLGTAPNLAPVGQDECCPGAPPAPDESLVVNPNGTLRNVVVYVKNGPNIAPSPTTAAPAPPTLDQKFCRYLPHVLAVHTDDPINVTSHDPVVHNVDVQASANPAENFSQTTDGSSHQLSFAHPEFVHIKCDVHPWMTATVAVFDHPFFAVTGDDGTFHFTRLPPGNYTLVAWQEELGELEQPFTVGAGATTQPAPITFEYKPQ